MGSLLEIPLSGIVALNQGVVANALEAGIVVDTDPAQWAYSAETSFDLPGGDADARMLRVRMRVENGVFGVGLPRHDGEGWIDRTSAPSGDEIVERFLVIPAGTDGRRLVFDNWSPDGLPSRAVIHSIDAQPMSAGQVDAARRAQNAGGSDYARSYYLGEAPPDQQILDPLVEELWPAPASEFTVPQLRAMPERQLRSMLTGDDFRDNLLLNKWEFATGKAELESYPWRLSVPFILCNAQCEFCAAWSMKGNIRLDDLMESLTPVIRRSYYLDLVGWGEPLIHPQFGDILNLLRRESDPRARLSLTTNGTKLGDWIERLLDANIMTYTVSLHSATSATHQDLMGFGPQEFDRVIAAIRRLVEHKKFHPRLDIELAFVVTQQNLAEIPTFISLAETLGVDAIYFRTLMPMAVPRAELDYHRLPPYRHPQFELLRDAAVTAISRARVRIKGDPASWSIPLFSPEWEAQLETLPNRPRAGRNTYRAGPINWDELGVGEACADPEAWLAGPNVYGRSAPLFCPSPYTAFYINGTDRRTIPCVYMLKVPGHDHTHFKPSMKFKDAWNSPAMVAVRRALSEGPLMPECLKCPFHCG